jgi:hypothetical protein
MIVETDFTSKKHTLVFENRRINLDKSESKEFERWFEQRRQDLEAAERARKEAIEILKKAKKCLHYKSTEADYIDQALVKLRTVQEQPPASEYPDSEFTKVQRLAIESCEASYEGDEWLPIGLQRLAEACDRLDKKTLSINEMAEQMADSDIKIHNLKAAIKELVGACELGLNSMRGLLDIGVAIGARNENKRKQAEDIKQVEATITKYKEKG